MASEFDDRRARRARDWAVRRVDGILRELQVVTGPERLDQAEQIEHLKALRAALDHAIDEAIAIDAAADALMEHPEKG